MGSPSPPLLHASTAAPWKPPALQRRRAHPCTLAVAHMGTPEQGRHHSTATILGAQEEVPTRCLQARSSIALLPHGDHRDTQHGAAEAVAICRAHTQGHPAPRGWARATLLHLLLLTLAGFWQQELLQQQEQNQSGCVCSCSQTNTTAEGTGRMRSRCWWQRDASQTPPPPSKPNHPKSPGDTQNVGILTAKPGLGRGDTCWQCW